MAAEMNPINWFEIPVNDLDRAKAFYAYVFGYELSVNDLGELKMAWFPMYQDAPGASGSLVKSNEYTPSHTGAVVYFAVEDIEETLKKVEEKGGKILYPKKSIGEYGFVAHFEDCEGNRIALHSRR